MTPIAAWQNFYVIHNAWDTVTYLVLARGQEQRQDPDRRDPGS